jgi:hypothetical protein
MYIDRKLAITTPLRNLSDGIQSVRVFPNPSQGSARLEITAVREDSLEIEIIDRW